ncbi:MAG: replicative DNA helicase [Elusimicrobia bacterium]|nr:replicative DNA helicase [Elusimicrobiota bacterium]
MAATNSLAPHLKLGPPRSPEAEKACLGALILDPEGLSKIEGLLDERDFFEEIHRRIFRAIARLFSSGRPVDLVTLHNELQGDSLYQDCGAENYLTELVNAVGSQAHLQEYSRIVRDKGVLRELLRAATEIYEDCYRQEARKDGWKAAPGIGELLDQAEARIFRLAQNRGSAGFAKVRELIHPLMEDLMNVQQNRTTRVTGVATGFSKLDELTSGFQKSDFIIVAARPSQGKTALALNLAGHVGLTLKQPVAFFSLEMSKNAILLRMLCAEARVDGQKLRRGFLERERFQDLTNAASRLMEADIYIDDSSTLTSLEVRARARRLASELRTQGKELSLVIIDYLQLLHHGEKSENRQQEVSEISRNLKALARDLGVPLVALSQLSRRPEERERKGHPQLSDLRESGSLEQDSDLVLMIYRPDINKPNATKEDRAKAEIIIAKQRNGPIGMIPMLFLEDHTRFVELESGRADDLGMEAETIGGE